MMTDKIYDVVVVGAGPAGLFQATQCAREGLDTLILEATEAVGGSARAGFSLLEAGENETFPVLTGSLLDPLIVRWERSWISPSAVDWQSKEWEATLPQWSLIQGRVFSYFVDMAPLDHERVSVQLRSPVTGLENLDGLWMITTPEKKIRAVRVYWAAGITAFQNAMGKIEAQRALVENPKYKMAAADYRGGLSLDWEISESEAAHFTLKPYQLFGLPLRFEGKFQLLIGALVDSDEGKSLRTFVHLHQDRLKDPKILSAFQKSMRRGLKTLFAASEDVEVQLHPKERSYVHDRIQGHLEGTPWVLSEQASLPQLFFIGEESLRAAESASADVAAALNSVQAACTETPAEL
jgi:hypothetical protein